MRAVICNDFGDSQVESVPRPTPAADEVLVSVRRVQLSVTECQLYNGKALGSSDTIADRMRDGDGRVFGHEFCGVVEEVGDDVTSFDSGDRVYAPAKVACGECGYCDSGYQQLCGDKETIGIDRPGALAEYISLPETILRTLPPGTTDAEGAAMQPLASAIRCVEDARIATGDVVVIIGCGVMGSQCGQLALERGASKVLAVDIDDRKLELADDLGMEPINAKANDLIETIRRTTNGIGADVVFSAVGGEQGHATTGDGPLAQSFQIVRSGGTVLQVGHVIGELPIEPQVLRSKSTRWINPRFGVASTGPNTDTGRLAPQLVADGRISIQDYVTHELNGLESFEEVVEITLNKERHDALGPAQIVLEDN